MLELMEGVHDIVGYQEMHLLAGIISFDGESTILFPFHLEQAPYDIFAPFAIGVVHAPCQHILLRSRR
jgi:hypothetical protein